METYFLYSDSYHEPYMKTAQNLITQSHVHPLYAMADEFCKPIEDCYLSFTNNSFRVRTTPEENIVDRFLFPEPADLLGLCHYLQVHPADLIPAEFRDTPSPRSVVQVCKMIATDIRFPKSDRKKADNFLDREIEACFHLADKNKILWEIMMDLQTLAEQTAYEFPRLIWRKNLSNPSAADAKLSKKTLHKMFGRIVHLTSSYPVVPVAEHLLDAKFHDLRALDHVRLKKEKALTIKKYARESVIDLGDKIFGKGNALEAYDNTRQVVRNITKGISKPLFLSSLFLNQTIPLSTKLGFESEEKMCDKWLRLCKSLFLADQDFQKWKGIYKKDKKRFKKIHNPKFTTSEGFEILLATFENYKIIEADGHNIGGWEKMMHTILALSGSGPINRIR